MQSVQLCKHGKCNNVSDIRRTCVCDFGYESEDCSIEIGKFRHFHVKTQMKNLFQFMFLCY